MSNPTGRSALLVHCHSEADSFVTAMRDAIANALAETGWRVNHSDLYAMGFNPVLSPADFGQRSSADHLTYALEQRHGYQTRSLAPDVLREIDKIQVADLVVFTFPVFWFSVPALLKGWIDRVFLSGPFYGGKRIYDQGGMTGKRALAAFSLGGHPGLFGPEAVHGTPLHEMLRHVLQGTFGYVGFDVIEPFAAWHVPYVSHQEREAILKELTDSIRGIDDRANLTMPRVADYQLSADGVRQSSSQHNKVESGPYASKSLNSRR